MTDLRADELVKLADYFANAPDSHASVAINVPEQRALVVTALRRLAEAGTQEAVPVAWVIPGDGNARDNGAIDAMAWREGEFTKPLYEAPPAPSVAVKVKPLTWEKQNVDGTLWCSEVSVCGEYRVRHHGDDRWAATSPGRMIGIYGTCDEAKAAAQSDYEQRITSALMIAPQDDVREALVEIKLIALTAGAPGALAIHSALSRIVRLCRDAGITETMTEIRGRLGNDDDTSPVEQPMNEPGNLGKGLPNDPDNDPKNENTALSQDELLVLLVEECGEVIQAATKCLRFGFDVDHGTGYGNNRHQLSKETGELLAVIEALPLDQFTSVTAQRSKLKRAEAAKAAYSVGKR